MLTDMTSTDRRRFLLAGKSCGGTGLALAAPKAFAQAALEQSCRCASRINPCGALRRKGQYRTRFILFARAPHANSGVHPSYINMIGPTAMRPTGRVASSPTIIPESPSTRGLTFGRRRTSGFGYTFPSKAFAAATVPVRVGDRVETGFHLVQLWMNYRQRAEEIMVFYPPTAIGARARCLRGHALDRLWSPF